MHEGDLATGPGGAVTQMRVGVLAYPGCFGSQIYSIPDLLTIAAHVAPAAEAPRIVVMSPRRHVTAVGGLRIAVSPLREVDVLVVPGFETGRAPAFATVLSQLRPEIAAIQDLRAQGTRVVSICVGAFLLAEAGLLTGRDATTSWLYAHDLAQAYPDINVIAEQTVVGSRTRSRDTSTRTSTSATTSTRWPPSLESAPAHCYAASPAKRSRPRWNTSSEPGSAGPKCCWKKPTTRSRVSVTLSATETRQPSPNSSDGTQAAPPARTEPPSIAGGRGQSNSRCS
jgi:putative intracellular protease/amidase